MDSDQKPDFIEEIKNSEQALDFLLNENTFGYFLCKGSDPKAWISKSLQQLFGISTRESYFPLTRILAPSDVDQILKYNENGIFPEPLEIRFLGPEGQSLPVSLKFCRWVTKQGLPFVLFSLPALPFFPFQRSESEHNQNLHQILDQVPSMIGFWDKNLINRFANAAYASWFGKTPDEIFGKHIRLLLGDAIYSANLPYLEGALAGTTQVFERKIPKPDGLGYRHSLAFYKPIFVNQEVDGFIAIVNDITTVKEAQEETEIQQKKLSAIIDALPLGIAILDQRGKIVEVNAALLDILRLEKEEILAGKYKTVRKFLKPNHLEYEESEYPTVKARKINRMVSDVTIGIQIEKEDIIWTSVTAVPLALPDVSMFTITRNITEKRISDLEIENLKRILEKTTRMARVGGWEIQKETTRIYWSAILKEILGVGTDFVPDIHSLQTFIANKEEEDEFIQKFKELMGNGSSFVTEIQIRRESGEVIWVRIVAEAIFENGQLKSLIGTLQDINDRKIHEVINSRYASIIKASTDAIYSKNLNGEIISWNKTAERLFGYTEEEVIGKKIEHFIPADRREEETEIFFKLAMQIGISQYETVRIAKNGQRIHVSLTISPIPDFRGEITSASFFARDIREKIQVQKDLLNAKEIAEKANKAKSEFVANMSHELRTPLNGILGFLELLSKSSLQNVQREYLETISLSANSLLEIVNDILDFSKIESGQIVLLPEVVNIKQFALKIKDFVSHSANEKKITLELKISDDLPEKIEVDKQKLQQILINLLGNAIKFTIRGSIFFSIDLMEILSDRMVKLRISVKDTGIGIAKENQMKIFQPFIQEDPSITRNFGGTGLGLTISNGLLRAMNSELELKSKLGLGSEFFFVLIVPYTKETSKKETREVIKHTQTLLNTNRFKESTCKVLVVEDNDVNMKLANTFLKRLLPKATFVKAENGEEAVSIFQTEKPDLIFMDIQMPILNGYEATRAIRSLEAAKRIPIIALTANAISGELEKCLDAGMDDYLSKPVSLADFENILQKWL